MKYCASFMLLVVFSMLSLVSAAQSLSRDVLSTNGGNQTAGGISLSWTLGETITPTLTAGNSILTQGFEQSACLIQTEWISPNPICAGNTVVVSFNASGIIGSGNIFTAELSDLNGSFYSPTIIGSIESNSSGTVNAVIPENTVAGTHYRIRVVADKPKVVGSDNGTDIILQQLTNWYLDADGDHYYTGDGIVQCTHPGTGFTATDLTGGNDCNDSDNIVNPGMTDVCNGIDDNCNDAVDENMMAATITMLSRRDDCKGVSIVLAANGGAGISYQWKKEGIEIPGATGAHYNIGKGGNYSVEEANDFGCHATAEPISINLNPSHHAIITPQGSLDICVTGSVVLQANGGSGFLYQWSKGYQSIAGATNKNYTAVMAAKYTVDVTNTDSCTKTSAPVEVVKSCRLDESMNETAPAKLLVYPNPANGAFAIELHDATEISATVEIQLFNVLGQSVYLNRKQMNNGLLQAEVTFNEVFSAGTYLVKVTVNDKVYKEQLVYQQ
ncbi:MAG: T9SS type A sorting domain-containing protein [Chitinophagales bacterium]|nr:T9SS type A sorting domain-containing protein [Chitinophagales bacterium]